MISGYTAAGKTTHCRLLAESLGYQNAWAAGMLLEMLGVDLTGTTESAVWFNGYAELDCLRGTSGVDRRLDDTLTELSLTRDGIVFDARYLPWASPAKAVRVWIESDLISRSRKCLTSLGHTAPAVHNCGVHINAKDAVDVRRVADEYGAVFAADPEIFDVVLDNSIFASDTSASSTAEGIRRFQPYLLAAVRAATGSTGALTELMWRDPAEYRQVVRRIRMIRPVDPIDHEASVGRDNHLLSAEAHG